MKLLLAVTALILASAAPGSGCGWTGLVLSPPDVEVHGQTVLLDSPLEVARVEEGSAADEAGMKAGMEILSLDGERWDQGGFLGNLVRLQTVQPGDALRIVARADQEEERTFRLKAEPCSENQARRRARTLANLGSMEGMIYGRQAALRELDEARYPEAREMYERVLREQELAREAALERLSDPAMREQIDEARRAAEKAMQQAQEEWRLEVEQSVSRARETMESADTLRLMEESLEQARESMEDVDTRRLLQEKLEQMRETQDVTRQALEDARRMMADEETGALIRRQMEESLKHAQLALEESHALEMERGLVQEQMRRALEEAARGGDVRRLALLQASEATQRIRRAGSLFRGASFQRMEPGISRHVGVDHGLLVLSLDEDSPLAEAGVEAGDVLLSVDGEPVDDGGDLFEIVGDLLEQRERDGDAPGSVELEVHQPSGRRTIRLPLSAAAGSIVGPL